MMSGVESDRPLLRGLAGTTRAARDLVWGLGLRFVLVSAVAVTTALAGWLTSSEWAPSGISASVRPSR